MTKAAITFLATALFGLSSALLMTRPAEAAGNRDAKIMLHALSTTSKNPCVRAANLPANCVGFNAGINNLPLYPTTHYTYLLVVDGSQVEGIAGVQCGIDYNSAFGQGVDVYGWTLCASLEFSSTNWPQDGGGNLITWDATTRCQTSGNAALGAVGVAGYFYMAAYTPDIMRVTRRPVDNLAKVANCGAAEDIIQVCYRPETDESTFLGAVGFGRTGVNPCGRLCGLPVEAASWSEVKALATD
ncbi:MAG TPA: hypothetical protein VF720_14605 [Candidatus Eisenbacteria bacterium]